MGALQAIEKRIARAPSLELGAACSAQVVAWPAPGGAIEITLLHGLVTTTQWHRVMEHLARTERSFPSVAGIMLLSQALIPMNASELFGPELGLVHAGALLNPRAMIVAEANAATFRSYAWTMADAGVGRFVFTGSQMVQALSWARAMGREARQERTWKAPATHRQTPSGG